jgi:hypothetical protein
VLRATDQTGVCPPLLLDSKVEGLVGQVEAVKVRRVNEINDAEHNLC